MNITVPLNSKLPPSRETRFLSREMRFSSREKRNSHLREAEEYRKNQGLPFSQDKDIYCEVVRCHRGTRCRKAS